MATTRSQTLKVFNKPRHTQNSGKKLNNSYVSYTYDDQSDDKKSAEDINVSLRDELALLNYELQELKEFKLSLERKIVGLHEVIEQKDDVIKYLNNSLKKLTSSALKTSVGVQTTLPTLNTAVTQTENNFNHISIQTSADLYSNNIRDFNKTDVQLVKTTEKEEIKSTAVQCSMSYKSQKEKISADNTRNFRKRKVLLLADSQGRGVSEILCNQLQNCATESIFKPNATIEGVLKDVVGLTKHFTKSDTLIISAGTNDALKNTIPNFDYIVDLLSSLSHFNVIFVSIPYCRANYTYNAYAFEINSRFYNIINKYKLHFINYVDINTILQRPIRRLHMSDNNKLSVYSHICNILEEHNSDQVNEFVNFDNLTYVSTSNHYDDPTFL